MAEHKNCPRLLAAGLLCTPSVVYIIGCCMALVKHDLEFAALFGIAGFVTGAIALSAVLDD